MKLVCSDLEGVLVPEIWIAFAEEQGIPQLKRTTREEPDYNKLMEFRLHYLKKNHLTLSEIQATIKKIQPFPGAVEFLNKLRPLTQIVIISDTFTQFASPLMCKLGWPTIFCNELVTNEHDEITGWHMRASNSKYKTVTALQFIGYDTIAMGDSYNDIGMIQGSQAGFFFRTTNEIKKAHPEIPAYEDYDELFNAIKKALDNEYKEFGNQVASTHKNNLE